MGSTIDQKFSDLQTKLVAIGYAVDPSQIVPSDFGDVAAECLTSDKTSDLIDEYIHPIAENSDTAIFAEARKALPVVAAVCDKRLVNLMDNNPNTKPDGIPHYLHSRIHWQKLENFKIVSDGITTPVSIVAFLSSSGILVPESVRAIETNNRSVIDSNQSIFSVSQHHVDKWKQKLNETPYLHVDEKGNETLSARPSTHDDVQNKFYTIQREHLGQNQGHNTAIFHGAAGLAAGICIGAALGYVTPWPLTTIALCGGLGSALGDIKFQWSQKRNLSDINYAEAAVAGIIGAGIVFGGGKLIKALV